MSHPCINPNQRPRVPTTFLSVGILVSNLDLIHRHWHQVYLNQTVVQSTSMSPPLTLRLSHQSTFPVQSQVDVIRLVPSGKQLALQVPNHTKTFSPESDSNSNLSSRESKVPFLPKEALFPQLPSSGSKP